MLKTLPGLNIQWPWSSLILNGSKTVETRNYPLPKSYIHQDLFLVETPGPSKADGAPARARIIGIVRFGEPFQYSSYSNWLKDKNRHKVSERDTQYIFTGVTEKWGWPIEKIEPLDFPVEAPKKRGIKFTKSIAVKLRPHPVQNRQTR